MQELPDILLLEKSVQDIRIKYDALWEAICKRAYPELDQRTVHASDDSGHVRLGKKSWPSVPSYWPICFYVVNISIESLCCDDKDPPAIGIWIRRPKNLHIDLGAARKRIRQKAQDAVEQVLEELSFSEKIFDLGYEMREPRERLLSALTKNGGQEFFEIMVSHLKSLGPLIPVIDAVFSTSGRRGK